MNQVRIASGGLVLLLCGALSGCASGDQGTLPVPSESAVQRNAATLSTMVCVRNEASEGPVRVTFRVSDTQRDTGEVERGQVACAEGSAINGGWDVAGTIEHTSKDMGFRTLKAFDIRATNPWMGPPSAKVTNAQQFGVCGNYSVGETQFFDDLIRRITITRKPDTNWKMFEVVIEDSRGQSGERMQWCHGGSTAE